MTDASPPSARWQTLKDRALALLNQETYISEEARGWFLAHPNWVDDVERDG